MYNGNSQQKKKKRAHIFPSENITSYQTESMQREMLIVAQF